MSSTTPATFTPPHHRFLKTIASKTETGQIGATDTSALGSAVETLDNDVSVGAGSSKPARLDPSQMKSRIDGLIGDAVSNGTLTDAQASTLKDLFSQEGARIGAAGGPHRGPPPAGGPPPSGSDDNDMDDAVTGATGIAATGTSATSATDLLATFIKQLQSSQSQGSAYTAGGSAGSSRIAGARLVNFEA